MFSNVTFVYTPAADAAAQFGETGWADEFSVRIVDHSLSLRTIVNWFTGTAPGVTVPVAVAVSALVENETLDDEYVPEGLGPVTRKFKVINAGSQPVRLDAYGSHLQNEVGNSPPQEAILLPGEAHEFEVVVYYFLRLSWVEPIYVPLSGGGAWTVTMSLDFLSVREARCRTTGAAVCNTSGYPVVLMDQPGEVIEIPASDGQKQAEALNQLCNGAAPWTRKVQIAEPPVTRITGDFTVKMGNTTYILRDIYFDVPDPDRAVRYREISTPVAH